MRVRVFAPKSYGCREYRECHPRVDEVGTLHLERHAVFADPTRATSVSTVTTTIAVFAHRGWKFYEVFEE